MTDMVALADIRFHADCQSRVSLDEETVAEYAHRMNEGAEFPPLVVFFDGSDYWLADGFHRYAAWKSVTRQSGTEETACVPADIRQGTRMDAVRHALSANAMHGKRREPGDYRKGYDLADKFDAVGDTLWRAANKIEHAADQKQAAILRADRGRS